MSRNNNNNNNHRGFVFLNAFIRGLASLWIVGAGFMAQGLVVLSANLVPLPVAVVVGMIAMLCVVPLLAALVGGILGLAATWLVTLESFYNLGRGNVFEKLLFMTAQIVQILVFRPLSCPPAWQGLPRIVKLVLFREPERLIAPSNVQLSQAAVKDEWWVFVNGISTTTDMALSDATVLYHLFGRPIWTCYNPTDGVLVDVLECIVDKIGWGSAFWKTKPQATLARALRHALAQAEQGVYKRVVIVAHSQGTIITSTVLQNVIVKGDRQIKEQSRKFLEIYAVADCAHQMVVHDAYGVQVVNYLENLSNGLDIVAWLGVLFPFKSFWQDQKGEGIVVQGNVLTEPSQWGHFFVTHYLDPFRHGSFPFSRLNSYRNGNQPPVSIGYGSKQRITTK